MDLDTEQPEQNYYFCTVQNCVFGTVVVDYNTDAMTYIMTVNFEVLSHQEVLSSLSWQNKVFGLCIHTYNSNNLNIRKLGSSQELEYRDPTVIKAFSDLEIVLGIASKSARYS